MTEITLETVADDPSLDRTFPGGGMRVAERRLTPSPQPRYLLRVKTRESPWCPRYLQMPIEGLVVTPGQTYEFVANADETRKTQMLAADQGELERCEQAKAEYEAAHVADSFRRAAIKHLRRSELDGAPVAEIRALYETAATDPRVAAAIAEAKATEGISTEGMYHSRFGTYEGHSIRPLASVEVLEKRPPLEDQRTAQMAKLVASLTPAMSADIAAVIERLEERSAQERKQLGEVLAAALDRIGTTSKGSK